MKWQDLLFNKPCFLYTRFLYENVEFCDGYIKTPVWAKYALKQHDCFRR